MLLASFAHSLILLLATYSFNGRIHDIRFTTEFQHKTFISEWNLYNKNINTVEIYTMFSRVFNNYEKCLETLSRVLNGFLYVLRTTTKKFKRFQPFLSCGHHFLHLQRNFSKIQRKICKRTIVALPWGRKVKSIWFLHQIATFLLVFPKTPIMATFDAIMALWLYGNFTP